MEEATASAAAKENKLEEINTAEFATPTANEIELVAWITDHTDRWRDNRNQNYLKLWDEYERIFRGQWDSSDATRSTERSRLMSPATQQAVETRHAEIVEAVFGSGDFFDIEDDVVDANGSPLDIEQIKKRLSEDFKQDKVRKAIEQIILLSEIYGTGIGEIIVKEAVKVVPATQAIPGMPQAAFGTMESDRFAVTLKPVNPKNFLIDPNSDSVEEAMGCAIEKFVSIHKVVENMEKGVYRKVDIGTDSDDEDLDPTQEISQFSDDKVKVLTYYGLVPRELLESIDSEEEVETVDLFPEESTADEYSDLIEAIIVIGNDGKLLKAEANPYMMKDRPVVAYQNDIVPGRFWGRGTVEKSYNMQKAIDGQLRAHMDSLALTTAPMMGMDATRLPRGMKFEVKPGKSILTNGNPAEILMPFKFGTTDGSNITTAQNFERMLLQATGTMDSNGSASPTSRDTGGGQGMSMALSGVIKKYKRTLTNFQEDFLVPFINKSVYRRMQFDSERYPAVDMKFVATASLGILAREYEQQQFIALLQTLGPDTPVLPVILKGILSNSGLSNREEMIAELDKMSQPNPEAQAAQQAQQQSLMALQQAQTAKVQAEGQLAAAEAQKAVVEAQLAPEETKAKVLSAISRNLPSEDDQANQEFDRRVKVAELMMKEEEVKTKKAMVDVQMAGKAAKNEDQAKVDSLVKASMGGE
jgi:hypothetical protein